MTTTHVLALAASFLAACSSPEPAPHPLLVDPEPEQGGFAQRSVDDRVVATIDTHDHYAHTAVVDPAKFVYFARKADRKVVALTFDCAWVPEAAGLDVLDSRVRPGVAQRLKLLAPLVQRGPWLSDCLKAPGPVFSILESTTLPQDLLMPFHAVSMASLARPLSDGSDPYRWLFRDEHSKVAHNAIMAQTDRTQSREHRHGRAAVCANGQQVSDFDETFISNATIVAIGHMTNQNEIRLAQTLYAPLREVSMREFLSLQPTEFIIAAPNNTGKRQVYRVKIRPAVLRAGGETLRVK